MSKFLHAWLLTVCLAAAGAAQDGATADSFAQALKLQAAGDFAGAIREYEQVVAIDPSSFPAHANLGVALAHEGEYAKAITEYKAALVTAPSTAVVPIRQNMGLALYKSGQLQEAAAEFDAVRNMAPLQENAALLEADCYLRLGNFDRVMELLNPVSAKDPDNRAVIYMLGLALIRSGQPGKGQVLINRLLEGGESAEGHYLLGSVAFMAKDYPTAVREFRAAIALNAELPSINSYFGRALLFSGDPEGAADALRKQLAADANDYDANFQLAEILRFRKDLISAEPFYRKAMALQPQSVEARNGLAMCDLGSGRNAEARQILEAAVSIAPQSAAVHQELALAYDRLGLRERAAGQRKLAAELTPAKDKSSLAEGAPAPDFALLPPNGETRVRLSSFRGHKPVVLVFGSYTCPKFRSQVDALNELYGKYHQRAGFLLVYIREAHGEGAWQSTANERQGVALNDASNMEQKRTYASMCVSKLRIRYPAVVDDIDGAVEKRWSAFPSRVYVIDRAGRIIFDSVLDQQQFDPAALESALKKAF